MTSLKHSPSLFTGAGFRHSSASNRANRCSSCPLCSLVTSGLLGPVEMDHENPIEILESPKKKLSRQETPNSVLEGVYVPLNQILTHNLSNTCTRSIARSVGKTSMKDLNTTSLNKISRDISGPPGRKSIRDLSAGALYLTGPIQDLLISLDLLGPFTRALYKVSSQDHHV